MKIVRIDFRDGSEPRFIDSPDSKRIVIEDNILKIYQNMFFNDNYTAIPIDIIKEYTVSEKPEYLNIPL